MRISDCSSDVCSSDLLVRLQRVLGKLIHRAAPRAFQDLTVSNAASVHADPAAQHVSATGEDMLQHALDEIGRASCRERVCQYVSISVVAVSLQSNTTQYRKT